MLLSFSKKNFLISIFILSIGWFTLNYTLFIQKGIVAYHPDLAGVLEWIWAGRTVSFHLAFGNYMPVYPYLVYLFSLFFDDYSSFIDKAYFIKCIIIAFDIISYAFVVSILPSKTVKDNVVLTLLLLINVAIIYNSVFWGQIDGIHSFFLLLSFYSVVKNKWKLTGIFFALAFFTKIISIIFLPVFGLVILNEIICKRFKIKDLANISLAFLFTALVIILPIALSGNLSGILAAQESFIGAYESVSGNAYNVWVILTEGRGLMMTKTSDLYFRSITFQQAGMLLFIPFYTLAIWPLLWRIYDNLRYKKNMPISTESLLLICVLVPLVFFYFSTKIRERYAHPYLIFLTLYCFYHGRYIFWFLATGIYFLQLEAILEYTMTLPNLFHRFHEKTNLYSPVLISALFLTLILYLLHLSFVKMTKNRKKRIKQMQSLSIHELTKGL